jgi:hypothetical protein
MHVRSGNTWVDEAEGEVRAALRAYAQRIDRVLDRLEAAAAALERAAQAFENAAQPPAEPTQVADSGNWLTRLIGRA